MLTASLPDAIAGARAAVSERRSRWEVECYLFALDSALGVSILDGRRSSDDAQRILDEAFDEYRRRFPC